MRIIAFDKKKKDLLELCEAIRIAFPNTELDDFSDIDACSDFAKDYPCDIAFLDASSSDDLGSRLSEINSQTNLYLVSDSEKAKIKAMDLHACGFIFKPVTSEKIREEFRFLRYPIDEDPPLLLRAQCFGNFDAFLLDGTPMRFSRSKSKEAFAYLIYRRGASCTVKEIGAALFEDEEYDEKQQLYLRQIISTMIRNLRDAGIEETIQHSYNSISVNVNVIDCDYYRFLENDAAIMQQYTGEFMTQYPWAEDVAGYLDRIADNY